VRYGPTRRPDDPRRYRDQLNRELALGGLAVLAVVGGALIWLVWGTPALVGAALIFALVLGVVLLVVLVLKLLELVARRP